MIPSIITRRIIAGVNILTALMILSRCEKIIPEDQSLTPEKLLDYMKEWYLWNDTIPDVDPENYETPSEMLKAIRLDIDEWSCIIPAGLLDSLKPNSGILSQGFAWARDEQDNLRVGYVYEDSQAELAGVQRGWIIEKINGLAVSGSHPDDLLLDSPGAVNAILFSTGSGGSLQLSLTSSVIIPRAVILSDTFTVAGVLAGYVVIDNFLTQSYDELQSAFEGFLESGIRELVVDLRYNRTGLTENARYLANIISGKEAHKGAFVRYEFNRRKSAERNVTFRFEPVTESLTLERIYFITSSTTSGLAEVVINGLLPFLEVHQVGTTTEGAPVGIIGRRFLDSVLLPVTYKMSNLNYVTDFYEGLVPDLEVADDFDHPLGDQEEACLKAVLNHIRNGS